MITPGRIVSLSDNIQRGVYGREYMECEGIVVGRAFVAEATELTVCIFVLATVIYRVIYPEPRTIFCHVCWGWTRHHFFGSFLNLVRLCTCIQSTVFVYVWVFTISSSSNVTSCFPTIKFLPSTIFLFQGKKSDYIFLSFVSLLTFPFSTLFSRSPRLLLFLFGNMYFCW